MNVVDLEKNEKVIFDIISENLENIDNYKIFLFWSRANWNHRNNSYSYNGIK